MQMFTIFLAFTRFTTFVELMRFELLYFTIQTRSMKVYIMDRDHWESPINIYQIQWIHNWPTFYEATSWELHIRFRGDTRDTWLDEADKDGILRWILFPNTHYGWYSRSCDNNNIATGCYMCTTVKLRSFR